MSPELSVVIPVFNEENSLVNLYNELCNVPISLNQDYEIVFVDDGSNDNTFQILKEIKCKDNKVKIIRFRRNFGKSVALNVAFRIVNSEKVITMDGDLQDDPTEIPRFIDKLDEGYDLVSGWKYDRKDPLTKKVPSKVFNILASSLTGVEIHDFNCGFKAYRKDFLKYVYLYGEMHRYIPALAQWYGFTIAEIKVKHHPRKFGRSKYGFSRVFRGFLDLITICYLMRYSTRPQHFFGLLGMASIFAGFFIWLCLNIFEGGAASQGLYLFLSLLLMVLGLHFLSIGLMAEMIVAQRAGRENINVYIKEII